MGFLWIVVAAAFMDSTFSKQNVLWNKCDAYTNLLRQVFEFWRFMEWISQVANGKKEEGGDLLPHEEIKN